jgi:hypothetical protein
MTAPDKNSSAASVTHAPRVAGSAIQWLGQGADGGVVDATYASVYDAILATRAMPEGSVVGNSWFLYEVVPCFASINQLQLFGTCLA